VTKALQVALKQYKSDPDADRSDLLLEDFETFERRLGYADFTERALRYTSNKS
jgi:methylisocitrate lyase